MRNFGAKPIVIVFRFKKHIAPSVYRAKRTYNLSFILMKKHNLYDSMIYKEIIKKDTKNHDKRSFTVSF